MPIDTVYSMQQNHISRHPGPINNLRKIEEFTNRLRAENGKFSPELIYELYGVPLKELLPKAGLPE